MPTYQLQIKQLVAYPRCRIYREFIQTLIASRDVRTSGHPGLFCYVVIPFNQPEQSPEYGTLRVIK